MGSLPSGRLDDQTASKWLADVQVEYSRRWTDNTKPYAGVPELLSSLDKLGLPKAVLSNKADEIAQIMVESLLSDWSFRIVRGARPSVPLKPDPTAALEMARQLQIPPNEFLYLGDTNTDMQTANSAGMYAVGALWGFRDADELLANGARTLIKNPQDILNLLGK